MTIGPQSRKVMRVGENKAAVWAGLDPPAKAENVTDATPVSSVALQSRAVSIYQVLKVATKEYCFVRYEVPNELEDLHEMLTGCALYGKVSMVLANPLYSTREARDYASSTRDVLPKSNIENTVSFLSRVMASEAHGCISCSNGVSFY